MIGKELPTRGRCVDHHHELFSATIHSHLFLEAAKHGVALIICEAFKPTTMVLPANRSTDTLLMCALLKLDEKIDRFWQATIDAKCRNQYSLAELLAPDGLRAAGLPGVRRGAQAAQGGDLREDILGHFRAQRGRSRSSRANAPLAGSIPCSTTATPCSFRRCCKSSSAWGWIRPSASPMYRANAPRRWPTT